MLVYRTYLTILKHSSGSFTLDYIVRKPRLRYARLLALYISKPSINPRRRLTAECEYLPIVGVVGLVIPRIALKSLTRSTIASYLKSRLSRPIRRSRP